MQKISIREFGEISRTILENLKDGTVISISFSEEGGEEDVREEDGKKRAENLTVRMPAKQVSTVSLTL